MSYTYWQALGFLFMPGHLSEEQKAAAGALEAKARCDGRFIEYQGGIARQDWAEEPG